MKISYLTMRPRAMETIYSYIQHMLNINPKPPKSTVQFIEAGSTLSEVIN
jgi:hypothetical protein